MASAQPRLRVFASPNGSGKSAIHEILKDDPEINISGVQLRVSQGGHDVPEDLIRSRYVRSIGLLDDACAAAHRAYIFDNSGQAHQCIAEVIDGTAMIIQVDALPAWFTGTALWRSFIAGDDLPADESS